MATPSWDIFCRVVDNFGDAGVCWRLARQLAAEHGARVRLWIDDLEALHRLQPALDAARAEQDIDGVRVCRWNDAVDAVTPAQIVIEAFGSGVPGEYLAAMVHAAKPPLWIVLEYLSAELWVAEHHGLPSPHPRWPLERYFFFPGFTEGTGGLLREAGLFERRDRFTRAERDSLWSELGHRPPAEGATTVSLFAYESAPIGEWLACCAAGPAQTVVAVPESRALPAALGHFGVTHAPPGTVLRSGALELRVVPFVPQARYDELLWACDVNFVRGEDSFVRAQWAARPFVWHIYPQQEGAHLAKLEAFLGAYAEGLPDGAGKAVSDLMRAWNQSETPGVTTASAWNAYLAVAGRLRDYGPAWADRLARIGELAGDLAQFCQDKLK